MNMHISVDGGPVGEGEIEIEREREREIERDRERDTDRERLGERRGSRRERAAQFQAVAQQTGPKVEREAGLPGPCHVVPVWALIALNILTNKELHCDVQVESTRFTRVRAAPT